MRHLAPNFHTRFRNKDLMKTFKKLCMQNQRWKFDAVWRQLDEETGKHLRNSADAEAGVAAEGPRELGSSHSGLTRTHPTWRNGPCYTTPVVQGTGS